MSQTAINFEEEVRKCKTIEDLTGKGGLIQRLLKTSIENMLEVEMAEHLGREKYARNESTDVNYRNGYSKKKVNSSIGGPMELDIPRDRNGEFEPVVVEKYQTSCNELDRKIIAMYAKGMSTRDIKSQLEEIYGIDVSPSTISAITDKVMSAASDWQNRVLDKVYPIIYLDAILSKAFDKIAYSKFDFIES